MELIPPGEVAEDVRMSRRIHAEPPGSTLEDVVLGAWEDLAARGRAECPVCRGEIAQRGCASCASELS
jgi:hypothetical protein